MNSQAAGSNITRNRVLNQVSSAYGLSWWVVILFSVPTFLAQIVFDAGRLGGDYFEWLGIAIGAQLVAALVFGIGRFILLRNEAKLTAIAVLALYALVGISRALFIHFSAQQLGLEHQSELLYRLFTGPIYSVFLMGICAVMVSNVKRHRQLENELAIERGRLRLASVNLRAQVEKQRTELVSRVSAMLEPAIQKLETRLEDARNPKTVAIAVVGLRNTVDDVVRPLSHEIGHSNFDELMLQTEASIRRQIVPKLRRVRINLIPNWSSTLVFVISIGSTSVTRGFGAGLGLSLVGAITTWIVLSAVQRLLNKTKFRVWQSGLIWCASYFSVSIVVQLVAAAFGLQVTQAESLGAELLFTLMGVVFFVATLTNEYRLANIEKLRQANQRFQLLNSRLRRQVWLDHKRVASVLHGQVQGALYAAAIRLNQAENPDQALVDSVRKDIHSALEELDKSHTSIEDFTKAYYEIADMWSDSVKFNTEFTDEASIAVRENLDLAECLLEVVREGINNAVKHGQAKEISVTGRLLSHQVLEVKVINDGVLANEHSKNGYGSEILSECSHSWSLKNENGKVELTALFAV